MKEDEAGFLVRNVIPKLPYSTIILNDYALCHALWSMTAKTFVGNMNVLNVCVFRITIQNNKIPSPQNF